MQEREYRPLGSTKTLKADFRVIAATNRPISSALADNRLRADLYYRLNTFQIEIPPLRERKEDIPPLVATFLKRFAKELGKPEPEIAPEAFQKLLDYAWPGNVRELQNAMEYAVVLARKDKISVKELPAEVQLPAALQKAERTAATAACKISTTSSATPSSRRWPSATATKRKPRRSSASSGRRFTIK